MESRSETAKEAVTTREFVVVLRILTDDPEEDLRTYPFEDALQAPPDAPGRFVKVLTAKEVLR